MKSETRGPLADSIELYLSHKRSLGKKLAKVEPVLFLLDGNLLTQGVSELSQITGAHLDAFLASRPRRSPRSYNGLIGAIRGLLDRMVVHEVLSESPLRCESRTAPVSRSTAWSALWARCVRPSFIFVICASRSCGFFQSSLLPLFFRLRSSFADCSRVGVSMPEG